jgi:Uma2 family endonuclease
MSDPIELPSRRMTVEDYLPWAEAQPRGRFELCDGQVVAMAPERAGHARAKMAAALALRQAIHAAGLPCEAFMDGIGVRVDMLARNPVVVVEVTSPTNSRVDLTTKLADYFRIPSVQHYLVVHLAKRLVLHHRRGASGEIATRMLPDGVVDLDPPGLTLRVEDLFEA